MILKAQLDHRVCFYSLICLCMSKLNSIMLQRTFIVEAVEGLYYNIFFVILVTIDSITISTIAFKVMYCGILG